jgi:hypothetical protein
VILEEEKIGEIVPREEVGESKCVCWVTVVINDNHLNSGIGMRQGT